MKAKGCMNLTGYPKLVFPKDWGVLKESMLAARTSIAYGARDVFTETSCIYQEK